MSRPPRVVSAGPRLAAKAKADRVERRRVVVRRTGWAVVGTAPLVLLAWVLLGSSLLAVDKIVVAGELRLTAAQVENAVAVPRGTPLARVDTGAITRRVKALGPVEAVTVTRSWPDKLRITLVERRPVVAVKKGTDQVLLDGHGIEVDRVAALPKGVVPVAVKLDDAGAVRAAITVLNSLPAPLRGQLSSLRAASPEQVVLVLRDGRVVIWGGVTGSTAKASAALALLKMPGRVLDVSSPGVVTRR